VRFSPLVDRIAGEETGAWRVHAEGVRRREAGHEVIFLTVGDPDQAAPAPVLDATIEALRRNRTGYSPIIGYPQVRTAVAERMHRRTGQPCSADNVVLTPGTQGGLFCAVNCLAGPGDEVILPEPIYGPYAGVIGASGARMVNVPLRAEKGFHPDLDSLARAVTPRTRVIWINSPHNPTGAVFTADEVAGVAALCREHDLWLLSDEVYEDLAFARPHTSPWSLPGMAERTIVASSLSKSHAMAGFRFGWVIGPPALSRHLFDFLLCMYFGGPAFIQDGAMAALGSELPEVTALRKTYRSSRGRHVRTIRRPRHRARRAGFRPAIAARRRRRAAALRRLWAECRGLPAHRADGSRAAPRRGGAQNCPLCSRARKEALMIA